MSMMKKNYTVQPKFSVLWSFLFAFCLEHTFQSLFFPIFHNIRWGSITVQVKNESWNVSQPEFEYQLQYFLTLFVLSYLREMVAKEIIQLK